MPAKTDVIRSETVLVQEFLAPLSAAEPGAFGLLDDCASMTPAPGMDLVFKTDPVVAGVHFFSHDAAADIAWKALAVNVSDLAAKAATPRAYLLAMALPSAPTRGWMEDFAAGLLEAQTAFGCALIGGDTDKVTGPLSISITVIGEVPTGRMVRRGAAKAGDLIFVSGTIGDSAMGLVGLQGSARRRLWPISKAEYQSLATRYYRPQPCLALRPALLAHAHAAMDISDGLAKDLERMASASSIAATLNAARVPLSAIAAKVVASAPEWSTGVLVGGDDYEILCAIPPEYADAFKRDAATAGVQVTLIGAFSAGAGLTVLDAKGAPVELQRKGWDHFA